MRSESTKTGLTRRELVRLTASGIALSKLGALDPLSNAEAAQGVDVFSIDQIPKQPFRRLLLGQHHHIGVDALLHLMAAGGLHLYRSSNEAQLASRRGLISATDIVLLKVNATWKYRGSTNSDVVRGLVQAILEHPDGFEGEVVVFENSQGWGGLACDTSFHYDDDSVQANANRRHHSFTYVVDELIKDQRVSWRELDSIGETFIDADDHDTEGYRVLENVSYPCFHTSGGRRIELREGIWTGSGYDQNLKLINVPVLKHHDKGGSELTGAVKNVYGILSMMMGDELRAYRHYHGLGKTCAKMFALVRAPVLNVLDAIWVSHSKLAGYPAEATTRVDRLAASQDPLALDYWAAKEILFPIDENPRHHPDFRTIRAWMKETRRVVNRRGGLRYRQAGSRLRTITDDPNRIRVHAYSAKQFLREVRRLG